MSRIQNTFTRLKNENRKALIPFITAGYPELNDTVELMHALVRGGSDIIELGVPFSDPMADGPVIQRSSEIALENGITLSDIFGFVQEFRKTDQDTPVVLMGYANPVERMGVETFVTKASQSGTDGVLIVDYPPEESVYFARLMKQNGMDTIFLLAPTSTEKRMKMIGELASGYVYYVSLRGVTGASTLNLEEVGQVMSAVKKHVSVPVCVGFGIRDGDTARAVGMLSDGVVIGSRLIQVINSAEKNAVKNDLEAFALGIRKRMDETE